MKYNIARVPQSITLEAFNEQDFYKQLIALPEGEYVMNVVPGNNRAPKHGRRLNKVKLAKWLGIMLEMFIIFMMVMGFLYTAILLYSAVH